MRKRELQRRGVRSVGTFSTVPTQLWTYLPYSSFRHTIHELCLSWCFKTDKKSQPVSIAEWLYYCFCSAKRSPHKAKRERVGEERTKPASPTHTSLLSSLKELLYSPTWRGAKALCPAKNKLTFINSVRRLLGKKELRCCFWTGHLVQKHSACKAEKQQRVREAAGQSENVLINIWRFSYWPGRISFLENIPSSVFHNICAVIADF